MLSALASADGVTWVSILVKALAYAATLAASGSVLVLATLRAPGAGDRHFLRRFAIGSALLAAAASAIRVPVRASFLTGGTWGGATDPMLLGMVAESPLGTSVMLRLIGLILILALFLRGSGALWIAAAGAVLAAASFAFRGHALEEPRLLLGGLVTVHILALAFWIGGFAPLWRSARRNPAAATGALAQEFGDKALWVVAALFASGGTALAIFSGGSLSVLATPYGQFFALKLALFLAVLGLAALNKLRLTPALNAGRKGAALSLRRSIGAEAALVTAILLATATLTTISSPPRAETARMDGGTGDQRIAQAEEQPTWHR